MMDIKLNTKTPVCTNWLYFCASLLVTLLYAMPAYSQTQEKKIIFLAGPKDHGRPGRHEYEKDLRTLAYGLQNAKNLKGIKTEVYVGKAPTDLNIYKDAAAIIVLSSSDRSANETHPLFPQATATDGRSYDPQTQTFLKGIDSLANNGLGIAIFHYATHVENWTARGYYVNWVGGLWVEGVSTNPTDDWTITFADAKKHPILLGVKPWKYKDEIFCKYLVLPNDPQRTDLLLAKPEKAVLTKQVASWAYQRNKGRGFIMGGIDFHSNMAQEDYRKYLLNGIAWIAGLEIPSEGVIGPLPADFSLNP